MIMAETEEEKELFKEYEKVSKQQAKIRKEFAYLEDCDITKLQMEFVRAQAKEICDYLYRLRLTPFRSWEKSIKELVESEDTDFMYTHFITVNEFGVYMPDTERIDSLLLIPPAPGEFPER